ncbi:PREDICTED: ralA-binding protein 1 isoform X1 [Papilio polytes]|uniref:ralA-binding protein 1 isoform X1 n=1 Tax=Papilio polytes TaxID=76194 RepID=UPI00067663EC|nr:PREDICTED: ralA-binding protein 1 isoform X1 [Papilio polytes]
MHHLRSVFTKEKEEKAKFKLESKEKLKDDKKDKVKEKEKDKVKEKEKEKVKEKDKDKKDKKLTKVPSTVTSGVPFEEIFTLGVALPIFGVPLQQSVERSRCHDDTLLPLVVRDSIDFLQAHGLKSNQIYRADPDKIKLQQLRRLFTDRGPTFPYHWDVPVACAMLKAFISELPDSILTQELHGQFEQATAMAEPQREAALLALVGKLPAYNHNLLAWLMTHFAHVVANEQVNQANIQTITNFMGPALNMSQNLLTYLITKADKLFPNVSLEKYVPPLLSMGAEFPECGAAMRRELRKQESLLSQIHAEMHAGFITPARDQRLWEAQRIVTQLKRKLRSVQKSVEPNALPQQPSVEDKPPEEEPLKDTQTNETITQADIETIKTPSTDAFQDIKESPNVPDHTFPVEFEDNFNFQTTEIKETPEEEPQPQPQPPAEPVKEKPKLTEKELKVLRLELENAEYLQLKSLLQAKINSEQFEIVKLRSHVAIKNKQEGNVQTNKETKESYTAEEQELRQKLIKENAMLEQKRLSLVNQIFQERVACVQLKIELAMNEILSKS